MVPETASMESHGAPAGPAVHLRDFPQLVENSTPRRVLVVDDEALVRWSLAQTLIASGYEVAEAEDGASAVRAVSAGAPDLVLLDLRLPDSSDLHVLSAIRDASPATRVILMTAFGTPDIVADALEMGACSVVAKPFDMADVAPLVRRALS